MVIPISYAIDNKTTNELARRTIWQAKFSNLPKQSVPQVGKKIAELTANSPLATAGLKVNDILLAVDSQTITNNHIWNDITDALVSGHQYKIDFQRQTQRHTAQVSFPPLPKENHPNLITTYQTITNPYGIKQRLIITKPKSASTNKKWPAVFIVQGLSCSSIELTPNRASNYSRLLRNIVTKSNMLVMRIEKPGLGDSEGNCSTTDFYTELSGYEAALNYLKTLPDVNPNKILIYGNSMGSALAPYLANKYHANAVIADGTFFRSWFEHMLEIERRIKSMQGLSETEINQQINQAYIPLYYGMLVEKKSYQALIDNNPLLAKYNYHGPNHMYGRPLSYYQQLQNFDFAGQWQQLKVPVKIRWGTNGLDHVRS